MGDHGRGAAGVPGAAAPLVLGVMFPRFRIMLRDSPGAANWRTRRAARDWLTAMRVGGRWPVGTRADAGAAGALVFAVLAGWRRIPSPAATASGSPNRLLCPDPVRHMSVIMGSVEHATAYRGGLPRRIERADGTDPVGSSPRSAGHKRTQHRSAEKAQAAGENPSRVQSPCLSGRFCRPLALASSADRDKIPNHRADLLILRVVTGGRCWVRTNVG